jgi:hypothetical protein
MLFVVQRKSQLWSISPLSQLSQLSQIFSWFSQTAFPEFGQHWAAGTAHMHMRV